MKATAEKDVPEITDIDASLSQQENESSMASATPKVTAAYKEKSGYTLVIKASLAIPLTGKRGSGTCSIALLLCNSVPASSGPQPAHLAGLEFPLPERYCPQ